MIVGWQELLISHLMQHGVFFFFSFVIFLDDLSKIRSLRYVVAILALLSCFQIGRWSHFVLISARWRHLKHPICLIISHLVFIVASSRYLPCHQSWLSFLCESGILIDGVIVKSTKRTRNRKALLRFSLMDSILLIGVCLVLSIHDIRQIWAHVRHIFFSDVWIYANVQVLVSLLLGSLVLVVLHLDFTVILRIQMIRNLEIKLIKSISTVIY
jgi:hypothetical protein